MEGEEVVVVYKNKNKNIYYSSQWALNRGKQIAYIDYCHWRTLEAIIRRINARMCGLENSESGNIFGTSHISDVYTAKTTKKN
jgi:hypothetical protein